MGLNARVLRALHQVQPLAGEGPLPACRITVDWFGTPHCPWTPSALLAPTSAWRSATPYYPPWHIKPRLGPAAQLARECAARGLPPLISLEQMDGLDTNGAGPRSAAFLTRRLDGRQPHSSGGL